MKQEAETIIIGAGAAGIMAARTLQDAGRDVMVLEARSGIGGRICTDEDNVEYGAEFIHGNVPTHALLKKYGLTTIPDGAPENGYVYLDGELKQDARCEHMIHEIRRKAKEACEKNPELGTDRVIKQVLRESNAPAKLKRIVRGMIESEYGAQLRNLSVQGFQEPSSYDEENYRIKEGYLTLLERMSEDLDIRTSTPVNSIRWNTHTSMIATMASGPFFAKRVISTMPIGILKERKDLFTPPLPGEKQRAIARLGNGDIWKIIAHFRERVWPEDMAVLRTPLQTQVWWPAHWGRENPKPILTALVGANGVKKFEKDPVLAMQVAMDDLRKMFEAEPEKVDVVPWTLDAHIRTGYSFLPPKGNGARIELAAPVDDVLFFAGEATDHDAGTVHGALHSGKRAAEEVLRSLK